MRVLITGFEPFNREPFNPSQGVLELVRNLVEGPEITVTTTVLPVDVLRMTLELPQLLRTVQPDVYLALGLAPGRTTLSIERVGLNVLDFPIPDNGGNQPIDQPVIAGGPLAYATTLPIKSIVEACRALQLPLYVSNSAGTYLCNAALYLGLHWASTDDVGGKQPRVGFIHVPYAMQYIPKISNSPALPLEFMARVIAEAIQVTLKTPMDIVSQAGSIT